MRTRCGSLPERSRGGALFVVEDLGVGDAGAVIDRGVDESIPNRRTLRGRRLAATVDPPPAPVGDPRQLLHVDMHQLTGSVALIAARLFSIGGAVTSVEAGESFGTEHGLDR